MTDDARRVLTEEERARMHIAARAGGICAGCGRALAPDEPIWRVSHEAWVQRSGARVTWVVPVGTECVGAEVRAESLGQEPERCGGCGRPVYQRPSAHGVRPFCCTRCRSVAKVAETSERRRQARG